MVLKAPNMENCNIKQRCLNGPNEGLAYDPSDPCPPDLYEFNPTTCDCDPFVGYETWRFYQSFTNYSDGTNCCEIGPTPGVDSYSLSRTFSYGAAVVPSSYIRFGIAGYRCSGHGEITVADITGAKWCVLESGIGGYGGLSLAATQTAKISSGTYLEDGGAGVADSVWAVMTYLCDVTLNGYEVKAGDKVSYERPPGLGLFGDVDCVWTYIFIDGAEGVGNQATCP